mmetsp:Transcript_16910/g.56771  ORF Transcript_16910/g.56771 Transcript_16910/m.56771 type:complete len:201 (-) Transcript_16910:102-704(-)
MALQPSRCGARGGHRPATRTGSQRATVSQPAAADPQCARRNQHKAARERIRSLGHSKPAGNRGRQTAGGTVLGAQPQTGRLRCMGESEANTPVCDTPLDNAEPPSPSPGERPRQPAAARHSAVGGSTPRSSAQAASPLTPLTILRPTRTLGPMVHSSKHPCSVFELSASTTVAPSGASACRVASVRLDPRREQCRPVHTS